MLNIILLLLCCIIFAYCIYLTVHKIGKEPKYMGDAFVKDIEKDGLPYQNWQFAVPEEIMLEIKDGDQIVFTVHKE